jgi:hypothetical protein
MDLNMALPFALALSFSMELKTERGGGGMFFRREKMYLKGTTGFIIESWLYN